MSKFFEDFKKFAMKGNVVDMAVGVVVGGAFSKIVTSLVNDIIMPLFSLFTQSVEFTSLKLVMRPAVLNEAGEVIQAEAAITYGAFLQNVVDFLLIALSIFVFIRIAAKVGEKLRKKEEAPAEEAPA
ncbi:MAG: large conductance mechanosensitive channel protein MscL, partial [Oscillospiraceae bacterium]|nr:large conductance mechanosensitive channel protein MscL [Oscillospiraceae bacterium]